MKANCRFFVILVEHAAAKLLDVSDAMRGGARKPNSSRKISKDVTAFNCQHNQI